MVVTGKKNLLTEQLPKKSSILHLLPLRLSYEERRKFWPCPKDGWFVGPFTCLQCPHYELNNQRTTTITKQSGKCRFPHTSPITSRRVTSLFRAKVEGSVDWSATSMPIGEAGKKKRQAGGMSDKKSFMVDLIKKGKSKDQVLRATKKQYPEMKDQYRTTLYYHAMREARNSKEKGAS